jgi:hypothetical protein
LTLSSGFGFAGVDDVLFRVNRLEYPASIDTLHQSHVGSQGVSGERQAATKLKGPNSQP